MVLAKNLQLALFHVTWSNLCMYTQNKKNQLANSGATGTSIFSLSGTKEPKEFCPFQKKSGFASLESPRHWDCGVSSRALLFSLFRLVTVRCAALRGRGGGGCGGGVGRGGAVWAVGEGPHSGLRVYRFREVDAMDEADELFHLVQGAAHLLLPCQDGVLHLHTFLQQVTRVSTQPLGPGSPGGKCPINQALGTAVRPTTLLSHLAWADTSKEGRHKSWSQWTG